MQNSGHDLHMGQVVLTPGIRASPETRHTAPSGVSWGLGRRMCRFSRASNHVLSRVLHRSNDRVDAIGAPVLDGMITGFKMAEMMADLRNLAGIPPVSRAGFFQFPPQEDFKTLRGFFNKPG